MRHRGDALVEIGPNGVPTIRAAALAALLHDNGWRHPETEAVATRSPLPDLPAGVYLHYKGHYYLVLGYGHDANRDGRQVVVYIGLELAGAKPGGRIAVRDVDDFLAVVDPATGEALDRQDPSQGSPRRFTYVGPGFTYVGPTWEGSPAVS
jgi:hypothetical protein